MKQIEKDIAYVKKLLPSTYKVKEGKSVGSIHCVSRMGIFKGDGHEDEQRWYSIFTSIKKHFGKRFSEVNHNVCSYHCDFTIYTKK